MDFLFGSTSATQPVVPDTALRIQTAVQGKVRPIGCGQDRFAGNLIQAMDFKSIEQDVGGKGGVFSGGKGGASQFTYTEAVLIGLCEGPIDKVIRAWDQQNKRSLAHLGASVFLGGYSQMAPGYITTNHPDQADNNRGLAEVGMFPAQLGNSSALPNWSWEVIHAINSGIPGAIDADPRDWILGLLTNVYWSVHFPDGNIDSLDLYSSWCRATGMLVSDTLVSAQALNGYLDKLMEATCSEFFFSGGKLKIVPYGDVIVSGNGATYTPPDAPVVTLGAGDFLELTGGGNSSINSKVRVQGTRPRPADYDNWVQVQFLNRANDYNKAPAEAKDETQIELLGYERNQAGVRQFNFFKLAPAALVSAHLILGRQLVRNQYSFALGQKYLFLDPMDIVALNDAGAGLVDKWVRIKEITENQDGSLTFLAEEYLQGTGTPYNYDAQAQCCPNAELAALIADPGPTAFAYWDASLCAVADGPALIVSAGGVGVAQFPRPGQRGLISDWVYTKYFHDNPTASGTQRIFKSAPNESGASFELKAIFSGAGANVQIGLEITATPEGAAPVTVSKYADAGPQASIPANGFGVIATWDFSAATWAMHVRVNAGAVAAFSTNEGDPMDAGHPLFQNASLSGGIFGDYEMGDGSATSAMYWSQAWIGLDDDVDGLDLTIPDAVWKLFYCDTGSHAAAPRNLNADGSKPNGCPPSFYFDKSPTTAGYGAGVSTGCLAGDVLPNHTGGLGAIGAGTIPPCGSYQAVGTAIGANAGMSGPQPFGGLRNIWGSAEVWISTNGPGGPYNRSGFIPGASAIGELTAAFASHADPDTVNTLSVNLTESQGELPDYVVSDADLGRSRCVVDQEIIDYTNATLTGPFNYDLDTYIRRGQLGSVPAAHAIGAKFALLGSNAIPIKYPAFLIGSTIHVKFAAQNKTGGGGQTLADVPAHAITLVGPPAPAAPASLSAIDVAAGSGAAALAWPAGIDCGTTGYVMEYDDGGPTTTVDLGNQLSTIIAGLAPGTYTFGISSVNAAGLISASPTTTVLVVT